MESTSDAHNRILVALDVSSLSQAQAIVKKLRGKVGGFKVGLELLTAEGSRRVVDGLAPYGCRLFYDGKFDDIPNTLAGATRAVAAFGVWMFNVHASVGRHGLKACVDNKGSALAVAVTVLTSLKGKDTAQVFGSTPRMKVLQFARLAASVGMDGVVCSPRELSLIRRDPKTRHLMTIVPGVRPAWAALGDQARVMTPGKAIAAGADYLVIGRPILKPPSSIGTPAAAVREITKEIQAVLGKAQ